MSVIYSGGQLKINKALFSYKMPLDARVKKYLNVMQNLPIFSQMLVLMWEASQGVLVPKFWWFLSYRPSKLKVQKRSVLVRKNEN